MKKPENISKFLLGGRNEEAVKAFYQPPTVKEKERKLTFSLHYLDSSGNRLPVKG